MSEHDSPRVVSLLPSATEIVYALGIEPVGVSHECDYPPAATAQPAVNRSLIEADASSAEINEQVAAAERDGGDPDRCANGAYEIDLDRLDRLDPDLIVTQGVCDVCAVDRVLVEDAVERLGLDATVLTTDPHSLEDVFEDVRRIGEATGRADRAEAVVADLRERVAAVEETISDADPDRPRVAVLDWLDPVMVAGHWIPAMVETAGGRYDMTEPGARSEPREWAELREYDPEVLVAAPCGFELDQTLDNRDDLTGRPGWDDLAAVRNDRVTVMDGHHYVNRSGPRLVDTLEYLAAAIHPDLFDAPPADAARPLAELRA
ncbi:MAG: cobalamin-binding protein [Haloarculaceae archaeon]